ncbi:hypothetical protein MLD38_029399 [Melastoma candidum]|uniref:Uncharacterized protein n=1 Tax=Melastoma candidum TaxID=119954 RepID=A0ACB9N687_9MYRT|nr:hypothetical protein MLD38_029399 [Melastoma candidum]
MDLVSERGAGFDALAALKFESLVVEAAVLAQGSVYLLLLAMGLKGAPDLVTGFPGVDQRRNADSDFNEAKDAEGNGDVDDDDDSEDGNDDGDSDGEDSEDIAEDDEEEDSDVNGEEGSDEEEEDDNDDDEDEDDDEDDDEEDDDEDDEEEDQRPQKKKK